MLASSERPPTVTVIGLLICGAAASLPRAAATALTLNSAGDTASLAPVDSTASLSSW